MWQGSQNVHATQKECHTQNKQMTAVGYILDTEEIVNASWSLSQNDGAAAFQLLERSPLPAPLCVKDLPAERTEIFNVSQFWRINRHPVERDEECAPRSISDSADWIDWNAELDSANHSGENCGPDFESDIEQHNSIEDPDWAEQLIESAAANPPRLFRPTHKSKRYAEKVLMTVNAIETRRNKGVKKK